MSSAYVNVAVCEINAHVSDLQDQRNLGKKPHYLYKVVLYATGWSCMSFDESHIHTVNNYDLYDELGQYGQDGDSDGILITSR